MQHDGRDAAGLAAGATLGRGSPGARARNPGQARSGSARGRVLCATAATATLLGAGLSAAQAQQALPAPSESVITQPTPAGTPPSGGGGSTLSDWFKGVTFTGLVEGGVLFNARTGPGGRNFGQLTTDHANQAQLNQILLTVQRTIDPSETGYAFGFKLQGLYGSDARIYHFLGEIDRSITSRYQLDIVEANVTAHLPWFTEGGVDAKLGQFSTPIGVETIDPSTNAFYSHSYSFNFGVPYKHTGILTQTHVTPNFSIYLGIDSGVNTSLGRGDNNDRPGGIAGFGATFFDGKVTLLALTHIGPENPTRSVPQANSYNRYLNDVSVVYKPTDKLTLTTEFNYIRDDYARAEGWGFVQYASYALNDKLTLNGRAEIWRDNDGFFVAGFPGNRSFVDTQLGFPTTITAAPPTTYGAFTAGVTYKPGLPGLLSTLMFRPEIRYDRSLNDTKPFGGGHDNFTFGGDLILTF